MALLTRVTAVPTLHVSPLQESEVGDGERLPIVPRDLGSCEIFPQSLTHNCNGTTHRPTIQQALPSPTPL